MINRQRKEKVVLAYSGGLDTTVAIPWLEQNYDLSVIAVVVDVGQGGDFKKIEERARKAGAVDVFIIQGQEEYATNYILPALKANALYEDKYPLVSALSRPFIAKSVIEVASRTQAAYVAHGCTGKGNDQVRFEVSFRALNPDIKILAPAREWQMSREEALDYAKKWGIQVEVTRESPYSIDENLWGRAIECGVLEDPWIEAPEDAFFLTTNPERAVEKPLYVEITFEKGKPIALNKERVNLVSLIKDLSKTAGQAGFGRVDMVENRLVGIKSREVYEVPGALALIEAHRAIEDLTLDREVLHFKRLIEQKYAELIYYGLWFSPLKQAIDAFIEKTQEHVNGTVKLKFYKGSCQVVGRKSPESLYQYELATYSGEDSFSHQAAAGFIKLFGLPVEIWSRIKGRR
jgi:argininosuccinate synthase